MDIACLKCARFLELTKVSVQHFVEIDDRVRVGMLRTTGITDKKIISKSEPGTPDEQEYDVRMYYNCPRCLTVYKLDILQSEINKLVVHKEGVDNDE